MGQTARKVYTFKGELSAWRGARGRRLRLDGGQGQGVLSESRVHSFLSCFFCENPSFFKESPKYIARRLNPAKSNTNMHVVVNKLNPFLMDAKRTNKGNAIRTTPLIKPNAHDGCLF
jgi:hypothetical protein